MHNYDDKWMRVNSDDPNSQVCSGRLTTALQRPKPSFTASCKKRYTPHRVTEFIESQSSLSHRVQTLNSINSTNS